MLNLYQVPEKNQKLYFVILILFKGAILFRIVDLVVKPNVK